MTTAINNHPVFPGAKGQTIFSQRYHRIALALTASAALSGAATAADTCPAKDAHYYISMAAPNTAHIRLDYTLVSDKIDILYKKSEDGTANDSFIKNARITSPNGTANMNSIGPGTWSVTPAQIGDQVTVEYDLILDHGNHPWNHGREEMGFVLEDNSAYLVSRFTMMADYGAQDCGIDITFETKQSAAPWEKLADNRYHAKNLSAFTNNAFSFGDTVGTFKVKSPAGNIVFVHDKASTALAKQAADETGKMLEHLIKLFGGFPASNYHIFLYENDHPEGGAFDDSFAMLHPSPAKPVDAFIWRQGFIHEIIHAWLGHSVRPAARTDIEWFKEGFTDYLAIKTMWRMGYLDSADLAEKLQNLMRRHTMGVFMSQGKVRMTEAGANKSQNRMIVYGTGATLALMLDVEMSAKQGAGTFEKMLADLYANSAERYTAERLIKALDKSSDGAASRLIKQFDVGLMPSAFAGMLEPYGVDVAYMIPDMFYLELNLDGKNAGKTPAFLTKGN